MTAKDVTIVVRCGPGEPGWMLLRDPIRIHAAYKTEDVLPTIAAAEAAAAEGLTAAGFVAYEAAPAFDSACKTHRLTHLPLAWFALFEERSKTRLSVGEPGAPLDAAAWDPSVSRDEYAAAVGRIKQYLRDGDTYQVNYTIRLRAPFRVEPWQFFLRVFRTQEAEYCAFVGTANFALCSASPELFFSLDGNHLMSRPMKGTSARGLTFQQDRELAAKLRESEKNRAENVMIVDMVRNDMGRVAEADTVHVPSVYDIQRYPTVWQMTSTVACRTSASLVRIFEALFPCASITGAPKIRTMQIIRELEGTPRGVYTGCIGCILPGRRAVFNVAIRTVHVDTHHATAEYGVGGGIVWDSDAESEYEECLLKARVLTEDRPAFELLETLLWKRNEGYFLLDRHIARVRGSAEYFGFPLDAAGAARALHRAEVGFEGAQRKVRFLLSPSGEFSVSDTELPPPDGRTWTVAPAARQVDPADPFLYHKTTSRTLYGEARAASPDCDDVILRNARGEITESSIANVVVEKAGRLVTPPVHCGLLPGVLRECLLERGEITEELLTLEDVRDAPRVFLINSVRGWIPARMTATNRD